MSQITKSITVDTSEKNATSAIVAKQHDVGSRFLRITVCNEKTKLNVPMGATVLINAERADGESAAFACTVNEDGTVTAPLTGWMLALDDTVRCSISMIGEDGERLSSTTFLVAVESAEYAGDDIEDKEELDILCKLIGECADLKSGCENAIADADAAAQRANTAAETAESVSPHIDEETGRWYIGSVDTGVEARGPKGDNGEKGEKGDMPVFANAGSHNSIYAGRCLGDSVTAEQYGAIKAGTFDDLYIGDYWTIGGVNWRIAAFDYYYNTGDEVCTAHHAVIVPDTVLYTHRMNDTAATDGAYVGSKMYTEGLEQAKGTVADAFGAAHILQHRNFLTNNMTDGVPSGTGWYDSTVELMTERNMYGGMIYGAAYNTTPVPAVATLDKSQYPLFAMRPDLICVRVTYWLRDAISANSFAEVNMNGFAGRGNVTNNDGVRPAFCICG